jgi:hypothetical protein
MVSISFVIVFDKSFETGTIVLLESVVPESVITITSISRSRSRARTLLYYRSLRIEL